MQLQDEGVLPNYTRIGDSKRNKFAVTSFILSMISLILSPLIIIQIVGTIFGVMGLKSEKKGLSIAGIIVNIVTIIFGIVIIITLSSITMFGNVVQNAKLKADQQMAININNAIVAYIQDTNDIDLKLGEKETQTVNNIIEKLIDSKLLNVSGNELNLDHSKTSDQLKPFSDKYTGWEITINKSEGTVLVKPSEKGDSVVIK